MAMTNVDSDDGRLSEVKQITTLAQIAGLSAEALTALDAGKVNDARGMVTAIRGVALNAEKDGSVRDRLDTEWRVGTFGSLADLLPRWAGRS